MSDVMQLLFEKKDQRSLKQFLIDEFGEALVK